jgi:3-hydroxyisobutyrate dehydrogenase
MAVIGWIGLGNMGRPMTTHLLEAGQRVQGFDVNTDAVQAAARHGVQPAASVAEAVAGADLVVTMLPKGEHVLSVFTGPEGILATAPAGAVLVDSSTIDVATAGQLHQLAADAGFAFVDAPVSGGISGAAAGTLSFMVGGDADVVARVVPLLEPMAGTVVATGGPTTGQAAKIVNNMMCLVNLVGLAEGSQLADRLGLDHQVFQRLVTASSGDSWAARTWYPVPGVVPTAAANHGFAAGFSAALADKDINLALAAGRATGVPLRGAAVAAELLGRAVGEGLGDLDCTIVTKYANPDGDLAGWKTA